jgi:hypothetical protein
VDLARWLKYWHNWRPGGAIRGKGRILDGKEDEWSDLKFRAPRWSLPLVSIKAHDGWVRMNKHLNVLTHTGHMQSPNLVASCVIKLDNTLPPYGCYTR